MTTYDVVEERALGVAQAVAALQRGDLVVLPTDTVYGVAADAFRPEAVQRLLDAKERGRDAPPPVLVPGIPTLAALAETVPDEVTALTRAFWPGGLTLVLEHAPSLAWDLGDAEGTVAVRLPDDDLTRDLLRRTGPLAVSSANITGRPAATDADAAEEMLGDAVAVIVDGGTSPGGEASTIIDVTVPDDSLWVMGDNRYNSKDSRYQRETPSEGFVPLDDVVGRALLISWPIAKVTARGVRTCDGLEHRIDAIVVAR